MNLSKEKILEVYENAEGLVTKYENLQQEFNSMEIPCNNLHAQIHAIPSWFKFIGVSVGFFITFWLSGIILLIIGSDTASKSLLGFGLSIGLSIMLYKLVKKFYHNRPQNLARMQALKNMENRATEITEHLKQLDNMLLINFPFLSADYCNPYIIRTMVNYLYTGRAHDLESMINLYELEAHRNRLELAQEKLLREQQYQSSVLQQLENAHTSALDRIFKNL